MNGFNRFRVSIMVTAGFMVATLALSGCANMSPTGQRALSGGAIGAAGGAVVGTAVAGSPAAGAAVGGAVGAGVGAALPQIENGLNGN